MVAVLLAGGAGQVLPVAEASAQSAYRVRTGDVLRVEILEDADLNRSVLVTPDGRASLPLVGTIVVAGQSVEAIRQTVANRLAPNFASTPTVYVSVEQLYVPPLTQAEEETISVFVMGEANTPGELNLKPGATLLQAFAAMGGFDRFAAQERLQLRRQNPKTGVEQIVPINYKDIEKGLSPAGTMRLADGDVIVIPQRKLFE